VNTTDAQVQKRKTGIAGLDHVTKGGLPSGQATLILGQAAAGKTVLGLQVLARAVERGEGGIFVTFEESPMQVERDAASFHWGAALLASDRWQLIDARPSLDAQAAGEFDIEGLLSVVVAATQHHQTAWVVFDGIDQLLQYQPNQQAAIDQIRRIDQYCEAHSWTLLLSGKVNGERLTPTHLEGIEFMLSVAMILSARLVDQRLNRSLRIIKYRGSGHVVDEVPMLLDDDGIHLPYHEDPLTSEALASHERLSTGIKRLDKLLDGGIYRGSSILISGRPGTAKSTLAASFAEAAAQRGERTLYVSFDEQQGPYVRNLGSVGIELGRPIAQNLIRFKSLSAYAAPVTEHFLTIRRLIETFAPHCLVIDPISALLKASASEGANVATEHLIDVAKRRGVTVLLTSLTGTHDPEGEATLGNVSTLADSWIVLDYNVRGGERNRSLSIVKSRGSAHSNQQREMLLSHDGIDLADIYEYGSEVLMGTARAAKEREEAVAEQRRQLQYKQRRSKLEQRINEIEHEQQQLQEELALEEQTSAEMDSLAHTFLQRVRQRRDPEQRTPSAPFPGSVLSDKEEPE
jgi:circadian clock protein KaiC